MVSNLTKYINLTHNHKWGKGR